MTHSSSPRLFVLLTSAVALTLIAAAPVTRPAARPQNDAQARGRYLVTVLGCNDCHTPLKMGAKGPEPDMSRMLSGHPESMKMPSAPVMHGPWMWAGAATNTAFAGPWGVSYSMNLTPDATGIAGWSEETFIHTMRSGRHAGASRPILPPMPWQGYAQLTDGDLKAVFAFLKSVRPIRNQVPEAQLAPPPVAHKS